jgi:hypothetical protein
MRDQREQARTRPGKCATHPGLAAVGACDVCGRAVCTVCAIPVRGSLVGPECLAAVLEDPPPPEPVRIPRLPEGDWLAITGFALVTLLSLFPWARSLGEESSLFGAWFGHWSLLGAAAALTGLIFAVWTYVRPRDARVEAGAYAGLGALVVIAILLFRFRPPPLSDVRAIWAAVLVGGLLPILGGAVKVRALLRLTRG